MDCINQPINQFGKYLLNTYSLPSTVLCTENITLTRQTESLLWHLCQEGRETMLAQLLLWLNSILDSFNTSDKPAACPCLFSTYTKKGGSESLNNLFKITQLVRGRAPFKPSKKDFAFSLWHTASLPMQALKILYLLLISPFLGLFPKLKQLDNYSYPVYFMKHS